jgi:cation diffusion facilitator CzcD-associated flavoprotein CzcO
MRAPRIAILGTGISGLCMAARLAQAGISSFTLFEKGQGVGGTWRDNGYPGCACDVPSHLYSFSFLPRPEWSRHYAEQSEILAYLERCADTFGIRDRIVYGCEIVSALFDDDALVWRLEARDGRVFSADVVVTGLGQLNRPAIPRLEGLASFAGRSFHSARWDHSHDLSGRQVAVVGTGASAVQFVPKIAPLVERLTVYQRSPAWILPRNDAPYSETTKGLFRKMPALQRLHRASIYWGNEVRFLALEGRTKSVFGPLMQHIAKRHLEDQITDPALRAKLLPTYPLGCKRVLISDEYYPALARPNVEVVTTPIRAVTPHGIVTGDGQERPADTLVFGTGFQSLDFLAPLEIAGAGGRRLGEAWKDGAEAYLGMTVAGFPNLFVLYGPNTNLGHNSVVFMVECQVDYIVQCLRRLGERNAGGSAAMDVRRDVMEAYNRDVQTRMHSTVWEAGCDSWYKTASGKVINNWPGYTTEYRRLTRTPNFDDFRWLETRQVQEESRQVAKPPRESRA